MAKRKNSVAYIRLDGNNQPIPGTMIYRQKKPYGKFAKMVIPSGDLCCLHPSSSCGVYWFQDSVLWTGPGTNPYYGSISHDSDGLCNRYTVGEIGQLDEYNYNYVPLAQKLDVNKNTLWSKALMTTSGDWEDPYISGLKVDNNGDVVIIYDIALVKLSGVDGSIIWSKQYSTWTPPEGGDTYVDYITNIVFDSNNDVYVSGATAKDGYDYGLLMKLDGTDGSVISSNRVDIDARVSLPSCCNETSDIAITPDDSIRLLYQYRDDTPGPGSVNISRFVISKMNTSLAISWSKKLDYTPEDLQYTNCYYLCVDNQGNTIAPFFGIYGSLLKLDDTGAKVWCTYYNGSSDYNINSDFWVDGSITSDANGDVIVAGTAFAPYNPGGKYNWTWRHIRKFSGVDGEVGFSYFLSAQKVGMNWWWNYTGRTASTIYGDTMYLASYATAGYGDPYWGQVGFVQTIPTNIPLPETPVAPDYIVKHQTLTKGDVTVGVEDVVITLTPFTIDVLDYNLSPFDVTNITHKYESLP